jgi:hypothetical protein
MPFAETGQSPPRREISAKFRLLRGLLAGSSAGVGGGLATGTIVAIQSQWNAIATMAGFIIAAMIMVFVGATIGLISSRPKGELLLGVAMISTVLGPVLALCGMLVLAAMEQIKD